MSPPLLVMAAFDGMIDGRKGTRTWLEHTDPVNMRFYTEDNAQFPAFVKALKGTYGMGIRIVHNRSQFDATLGGAFLSLGKWGPGASKAEGGREKTKTKKTEGAQGPRASRRLRVGVRKGPALQIHLRRGSKDPSTSLWASGSASSA